MDYKTVDICTCNGITVSSTESRFMTLTDLYALKKRLNGVERSHFVLCLFLYFVYKIYRRFWCLNTNSKKKVLSRFFWILYHLKAVSSLYDLDPKEVSIKHFVSEFIEKLKTLSFPCELNYQSPLRSEEPYVEGLYGLH